MVLNKQPFTLEDDSYIPIQHYNKCIDYEDCTYTHTEEVNKPKESKVKVLSLIILLILNCIVYIVGVLYTINGNIALGLFTSTISAVGIVLSVIMILNEKKE